MGFLPGGTDSDLADRSNCHERYRQLCRESAAARDFSGSSIQELFGPRDVTMKEVAIDRWQCHWQTQTQLYASAIHDARAGAGADGNAEENCEAAD